jgi:AraC-like DNA-binding protein
MALSLEHALGQMNVSSFGFHTIKVASPWEPDAISRGQAHLLVVLSGAGEMLSSSTLMPVSVGQMWIVGADGPLQLRPRSGTAGGSGTRGADLVIAHGIIAATLLNGRCVFDFIVMPHCADLGNSELFASAIPELLRESASDDAGSAAIVKCLVRRIATLILRDAWVEAAVIPAVSSRHGEQFEKIVEAMTKDPARQFTLDSLASAAGMSRTAFHKTFTKAYGKSPLALLRGIRLKKAEELLTYTDLPIKAISVRLGYRSRSYFWQTFKAAYGMDPESFRTMPLRDAH